MYTAIFGMFSFCWFGWAQENPRKNWRLYIGLASGIAFIISAIGIYLSVKNWHGRTVLSDPSVYKYYLVVVLIEFLLAAIGAFVLIKYKKNNYVAPWIALIVGVHFFWLKNIFKDSSLYILAILVIGVAIISIWLSKKLNTANSAITGIGVGFVLFCFAILGLIRFLQV
ncbi:hypothetical protein SAMN05444392_106179 [Seinonella peptonophila]|uniref:Uncharacterized protein n=1 Tax=Seinonella peptonophila TaxID=112248 RepID=A0A1M4YDF1_9BACL|nr:hypothetical protein [Seinonella peptonophila]SHF03831.1 hypothetical protein SAMN05444392_106179 [Seinonella peptonophila]